MKKASELFKTVHNSGGPTITSCGRGLFEHDGSTYKDIDGTGKLSTVNDWHQSPQVRAEAYAKVLSEKEKIGLLFTSDWHMAKEAQDPEKLDPTGLLDEGDYVKKNIFGDLHLPGTTELLHSWWARHLIFRANASPEEMTDFFNQLHASAEECEHFVPVQCLSNSRNENGEIVFGMNDAAGVFATWPGTLGIAAASLGEIAQNDVSLSCFKERAESTDPIRGTSDPLFNTIDHFADCVRREWNAAGLRKGYMYMADVVSDPRWQRTYGTFGENPELTEALFDRLIPLIQGSAEGITEDGVAVTVKHFPGGGARENGFDPHYKAGQWNVYATEGSLANYHLPPFRAAIRRHASSIMPYYSKPAGEKSAPQFDLDGQPVSMTPQGFAYNHVFIQNILREKMGFEGYINSDTGIIHNMSWGVENLDIPERIACALNNGVDLIGGLFDIEGAEEALRRTREGYYDTHPVPEGFTRQDVELREEIVDQAVTRTLREMFALGMFENPFRSPAEAEKEILFNQNDQQYASTAHRMSVVLLKDDGSQPGEKVYAECFMKDADKAVMATENIRQLLRKQNVHLCETPEEADTAFLFVQPSSGEYFHATKGYLELDLCDGKTVQDADENGCPLETTHEETTVKDIARLHMIADTLHKNGGKVFANLNVTLAWVPGNLEPYCDILTCGFDTYPDAVLDIWFRRYAPTGRLPLTLPKGDEVLKVNSEGTCVSHNDVPGYDKDLYMPDELKDENGRAYAYRDSAGNYYTFGFGLPDLHHSRL